MPTKDHGPQIKDDEQYEALRDEGYSKQKAARIANTKKKNLDRSKMGKAYEEWTKDELYEKAKDVDIEGRSSMSKKELIKALRNS